MPEPDQDVAAQLGGALGRQVQGALPLVREGGTAKIAVTLTLKDGALSTEITVSIKGVSAPPTAPPQSRGVRVPENSRSA